MDGLVEILDLEELVSSELVLFCSQCRRHPSFFLGYLFSRGGCSNGDGGSGGGGDRYVAERVGVSVRREGGMGVSGLNE